ncbi:MAG: metal ABC transporter permease [Syntrophorhabdaceae bacterium]|nr:metal ABC transporter permease [Syntrophorhabdaceae bacterium]
MNITSAFQLPFIQYAFIAVLFAGIAFPLIGVFIISLNLVPLRFAMMHIALLGGAMGLFFGTDPIFFALLFCGIASIGLGPLSDKTQMGLGILSGFFMTLTLAIAFILFYKGQINVLQAFSILWGNILALNTLDLFMVISASLFIMAMVFLLFKEIQAILYDRETALAVGIPEKKIYYLIVFVLGISIAVSMRLIGALLVDAFVLLPAIAAHLVARSLKQMFFFASFFGVLSGLSGLLISLVVDLPSSSTIILISSAIVIICILSGKRLHRNINDIIQRKGIV